MSILLLSLVLFSPWSKSAGGARRWLYFHYFSVQPLEFVKFTLLIYLSYFYGFKQDKIDKFSVGILPPLVLTLAFCTFLFLQPDFGGAVFLLSVFLGLAFVGGVPLRYFGGLLGLGIGGVVLAVLQAPYRLERIKAFLNPFQDPYDSGYQLIQSFYGLVNGGIWGVGLGESKQKFFIYQKLIMILFVYFGRGTGVLGVKFNFCLNSFDFLALDSDFFATTGPGEKVAGLWGRVYLALEYVFESGSGAWRCTTQGNTHALYKLWRK